MDLFRTTFQPILIAVSAVLAGIALFWPKVVLRTVSGSRRLPRKRRAVLGLQVVAGTLLAGMLVQLAVDFIRNMR